MKSFHTTAVFLGLSLKKEQASQILTADYYPPAQKGDIYRIVATGVEKIILIDGFIYNKRPVWQRELLDAIDQGIEVWGASAIGALRAVELQSFGMKGSGTIFQWYCDEIIQGDDEIAVKYSWEYDNFHRRSEPLVNIRYTLINAVKDNYLTSEQADKLLDYAKNLYYPDRSYPRLLKSPILADVPLADLMKIENYFVNQNVDLQKNDAVQILTEQAKSIDRSKTPLSPHASLDSLTREIQIKRLAMTGFIVEENIVIGDKLWQILSQDKALLNRMYPTLSKHSFLNQWTIQNNLSLPHNELQQYQAEWEKQYDIVCQKKWLQSNGLTLINYQALLSKRCLIDWLIQQDNCDYAEEPKSAKRLIFECLISDKNSIQETGNPELVEIRRNLGQRRLILNWARHNGIFYPEDKLDFYLEKWENKQGILNRKAWLEKHDFNLADYREILAEKAWEEWLVEKGINYFGVPWNFSLALVQELQITGQAAEILKNYYGNT